MADETRSEQLNQKVTPTVREKLDEILKRMGHYELGKDGHIKWDQDVLEEIIAVLEAKYVLDDHENYAEVVQSINQYTALINTKLISLISDLDTTEARIRSEYEKKLASKDQTIHDLQEQRTAQEQAKHTAMEDASKSKDAQTIAEKHLSDAEERLKKSEETVKDKESIIQMLTSKLNEADEKLAGYDALRASEASLRDQVTLILHQKEIAETKLSSETEQHLTAQENVRRLEGQIAKLQSEMATAHDELQSIRRDLEEQKRSAAQTIADQKKAAEQAQELAVERATAKAQADMREQIDRLRDEKTRLEVRLEMIQASNRSEEE